MIYFYCWYMSFSKCKYKNFLPKIELFFYFSQKNFAKEAL
ncbi:hypothetical protein HMPREF1551_02497 [Capnocytophaga sp. oral taxon 863 str. F0517]|nr:hypothetical protein HMPREF1551_02497 [Capnocytophaga sp. oral taxon 863 str. F0517]